MITEAKGYKTSDKDGNNIVFHPTLEAAQQHAVSAMLEEFGLGLNESFNLASTLIKRKSELLTILTGQRGKDKQPRKRKASQPTEQAA